MTKILNHWEGVHRCESPTDASTEDTAESCDSPHVCKSYSDKEAPSIDFNDPIGRRCAVDRYRIRISSIDSLSSCGWEFLSGMRATRWAASCETAAHHRCIPVEYVDGKQSIELISDVSKLRKGDHCVIALNVFRTMNSTVDYLHSWLSGYGYLKMFHHFLVLDDIHRVDENGVPRGTDGFAVEILEYSNTASQFLADMDRRGFISNFLDKAKCRKVALVDYGDNQYFYRFKDESLNTQKRDLIIHRAISFMEAQPRYHLLFQNCEHSMNYITMKERKHSDLVEYVLSNGRRYLIHITLTCLTLLCLSSMVHERDIRTGLNFSHAGIIQWCEFQSLRFCFSRARITKFLLVSLLSLFLNQAVTDSTLSLPIQLFMLCHVYWIADTLIFNSLVNLHAVYCLVAKS